MAPPSRSIVEQFEAPLLRYATRIVGDPDRARDVVQDTFLRLHEKNPGLEGPSLRRWLFTVCRNRAIDLQRQQRRWQSLDPTREQSVEARGVEARSVTEVLDAVERLPSKKKEVVSLRLREGRSYAEISAQTGLSVNHVGVLLHHSVRQLREHWRGAAVVGCIVALLGAGWWQRRPAPQALQRFTPPVPPPVFVGAPAPPPPREPVAPKQSEAAPDPKPPVAPAPSVRAPRQAPVAPPPEPSPPGWNPRSRALDAADPWSE